MTGVADLPLELTLDILDYLKPNVPSINNDQGLRGKPDILRLLHERPFIFDDNEAVEGSSKRPSDQRKSRTRGVSHRPQYSALRAMSQTNRYFHELCNPLLYVELDILPLRAMVDDALVVKSHYGDCVRHLRVTVTASRPDNPETERYKQLLLDALGACRYTSSLSIIFHGYQMISPEQSMTKFNHNLELLFRRGKITSLGIYSFTIAYTGFSWASTPAAHSLLRCLAPLLSVTSSLKHLEIAIESIDAEIYDAIRSKAVFLRTLTFRSCLNNTLEKIWSPESARKWALNANLTQLRLINCQSAYPPHIPDVVKHFSRLKYLLVSACGDNSDVPPPERTTGWSRSSDALWLQRAPLDTFHFEHMLEWEILAMGTIPAKAVIATSLRMGELQRSFRKDPELFPGLRLLSIEPTPTEAPVEVRENDCWQRVRLLRGEVIVKEDAQWLFNRR